MRAALLVLLALLCAGPARAANPLRELGKSAEPLQGASQPAEAPPVEVQPAPEMDPGLARAPVEVGLGLGTLAFAAAPLVLGEMLLEKQAAFSGQGPLSGFDGVPVRYLVGASLTNALVLPVVSGGVIYLLNRDRNRFKLEFWPLALAGMVPEAVAQVMFAVSMSRLDLTYGLSDPGLVRDVVLGQAFGVVLAPVVQTVVAHLMREENPPLVLVPVRGGMAVAVSW